MNPRHILFALLSMLSLSAADAPKDMQLFLLIGQSNMAGRGKVEAADQATNPRIYMLTKEQQWTLAKDPLHFDKPDIAGVGLSSEFARVLAKADPKTTIGLIPCAFGGTSLDEWKPGGKLYTDAITRAKTAMTNGTLAGILWHQGEADAAHDKVITYSERFAAMIAQLRKDLHAENVPVVIGELGRFVANGAEFNTALPAAAKAVPLCAMVSSEGLVDKGDKLHFDTPSLHTFGQRYATAFQKLATSKP